MLANVADNIECWFLMPYVSEYKPTSCLVVVGGNHCTECSSSYDRQGGYRTLSSALHCALSCTVYCNNPYLFVCLFVGPPYYSVCVACERFFHLFVCL